MTTYAIADQVPADCDYLTAGKEYEVLHDEDGWFEVGNDKKELMLLMWDECWHLNGGNWRRVEHD